MKNIRRVTAFIFMMTVMYVFTACGTTTIDLNKYIEIKADGYDAYGNVGCVFNDEAFVRDYGDKIKITTKDKELLDYIGAGKGTKPYSLLRLKCINYWMDKFSYVRNGETLTLRWNCNDELAQDVFNCRLKYSDIDYEVSDLKAVEEFDPFEHVEVSFQGTSPEGTVTVIPDREVKELQYINFNTDRTQGLCEGDTITLTAKLQEEDAAFVEMFGSFPSESERKYTVSGLAAYATTIEDIPQDIYEEMRAQGEDVFRTYVAKSWKDEVIMKGISFVGNYFLAPKKGMSTDYNNCIYYVYKINTEMEDCGFQPFSPHCSE